MPKPPFTRLMIFIATTCKEAHTLIKYLTPMEAKALRGKDLCYNYDEKFGLGHRCKSKQLVLIKDDSSTKFEETMEEMAPKISMYIISGSLSSQATQVEELIKHQPVSILIDLESTQNFINPTLAKRILCISMKSFEVIVANEDKLAISDKCYDL